MDLGGPCSAALLECLGRHKGAIVARWLQVSLEDYAENASGFLHSEKDRFRNPVGHAHQEGLPVLMDSLILGRAAEDLDSVLDTIIRMRAVQDFSASHAVAFVFLLKDIVHRELQGQSGSGFGESALAEFDARIDGMALLAFDLYVRCREQICEIKARSAMRQTFVGERMASKSARRNDE
jgi:hypothetical protein